ncbi:MAG TPA: rhodanese-like domain-containing protein [Polyangiaceae bacterium]
MTTPKTVTPAEAQALLGEGYTYLDVRTEAEFEAGHPAGALNVPLNVAGPGGAAPNPEFLAVVERALGKDAKLVVACQAGGRSKRAMATLAQAGFSGLVEMPAGFGGSRDAFGRPVPGWSQAGLPVETGRNYDAVKQRSR